MQKLKVTLLLLITSIYLFAGNDNYPVGARASSMGNAAVMTPGLWSVYHNQAGLAFIDRPMIGFHYENKYLVNELGLQSLAFAYPTKKSGSFGMNLTYFGFSKYNESKIAISYAKQLGDAFSAGVQLDYFYTHIDEVYGNKGIPVAEIGIMSEPFENFFIGVHAFNITRAKIDEYTNERVPTIFRLGIGYAFSEKALVCVEAEKDLNYKPIFKGGVEYRMLQNLYLRTGLITNPIQNSFGLGYYFNKFKADIAFITHPVLGLSSQISLSYTIGNK